MNGSIVLAQVYETILSEIWASCFADFSFRHAKVFRRSLPDWMQSRKPIAELGNVPASYVIHTMVNGPELRPESTRYLSSSVQDRIAAVPHIRSGSFVKMVRL